MSAIVESWSELAQGGRLLDRRALESLPEPRGVGPALADRLRDGLTHLPADRAAKGDDLRLLLDVVLEEACGLITGWLKGPGVGAAYAEKLVDGTELKPRRLLTPSDQAVLAVFTTSAERVGIYQGRRPVAHAVEYLRRRKIPLGLVTNGHDWRLIFADVDNLAWVQWAAERWLDGDILHPSLTLFRRVLSPATLTPGEARAPSVLLTAIRATRRGQASLSAELGERVRAGVELLLKSRRSVLDPIWDPHDSKSTYVAACHFVMRVVVVLFAEGRELLPVDSPIYHQAYGLRGLMDSLERAGVEHRRARSSAWPRLLALFKLLHSGSLHPQLLVTAYGGDLFRTGEPTGDGVQRGLAVLESPAEAPDDESIYRFLTLLTRTTERVREGAGWRTVAAPVDFTELTSEYIGILYEGLLDYELHRAEAEPIVFLGLGDQPALPLDRLEAMDDKQLTALVDKARVTRKNSGDGAESEDEGEETEEREAEASEPEEEPDEAAGALAPVVEDLLPFDDQRSKTRTRALKWAERAALVGKLIKAPTGRNGRDDRGWRAQLEAIANQMVVNLKLPGEFYLVRWGGTRKGAGTFYTRPQLTLPTVRRTLEPLLFQKDGSIRKPEDLLALKVCDPSMGSGSFLVAAIRVLTQAVVTSLHFHGRYQLNGDRVKLNCELLPEADRDQAEDRVEAIVRRAVVEHCVYGVDVDPLAVELARVALWVETLDRRLPFTFLDHKLRCGDALVGTWLDRFRDYPMLAWWRQSPDEKWRGVTHSGDSWAKALKARRNEVVAEQVDLLTGQRSWLAATVSDADLKSAINRTRELYRRLHMVPASQPDKRAEIWRRQLAPDPSLARVREAFDTWCALWFWPLDRLAEAPGPAALPAPPERARETVAALREKLRFFHWELEFPDVFTEERLGFDAVIANPPWETLQPQSKEFFANRDPLYRSYGKQEGLKKQREIFATQQFAEQSWLAYVGAFKDFANFVRNACEPFGDADDGPGQRTVALGRRADETRRLHRKWATARTDKRGFADPSHPFRHQATGKPYSYKLFVEQAHALLKVGGHFGLLTPSGLYTDKGAVDLRKLLLDQCSWKWLFGFENRDQIFDIDARFKFAVTIAQKGGKTDALKAAFMRHEIEDWAEARGALVYPAERVHTFSPKSLSVVEISSEQDLEVLTKMYTKSVPLGDEGAAGWGLRYAQGDFNMTSDSKLFILRDDAEEAGYRADLYGRWISADGDILLPLYEGRMVGQFDFSEKGWVRGKGRSAEWRTNPWDAKVIEPQYLMRAVTWNETLLKGAAHERIIGAKVAFMAIGSATNRRSMFATALRDVPCGNAVAILQPSGIPDGVLGLTSALNSFAYDFALRVRLGGLNLNYFVIEETPLIPPRTSHVLSAFAACLALAHPWFAADWAELRGRRPDVCYSKRWALTRHERLRLRCVVDAIAAALYGLSRKDLAWVLRDCDHSVERLSEKVFCRTLDPKGFWRIDKDQDVEVRHTVLTLVAFDALEQLIAEQQGDVDKGVEVFAALNGGEGWMLPENLRIADYGLGHDERAQIAHPVAARLGPRFLDWQLTQTPEQAWAECEGHAKAILGGEEFDRRFGKGVSSGSADPNGLETNEGSLIGRKPRGGARADMQKKLFE